MENRNYTLSEQEALELVKKNDELLVKITQKHFILEQHETPHQGLFAVVTSQLRLLARVRALILFLAYWKVLQNYLFRFPE